MHLIRFHIALRFVLVNSWIEKRSVEAVRSREKERGQRGGQRGGHGEGNGGSVQRGGDKELSKLTRADLHSPVNKLILLK